MADGGETDPKRERGGGPRLHIGTVRSAIIMHGLAFPTAEGQSNK